MRWSRLQQLIEELWEPELDLRINCTAMRRSNGPNIGRYWVSAHGRTIWQAPVDMEAAMAFPGEDPWAPMITALLRSHIDRPKEELLSPIEGLTPLEEGLLEILRAADRRLGKRRALEARNLFKTPAAREILAERFGLSADQ
jgi:hypothetical protein